MRPVKIYTSYAVVALVLSATSLFLAAGIPGLKFFNAKGRDFFFQIRHHFENRPPEINQILLVNLDDETLGRLNKKWPYPRTLYAEALSRLIPYSPKAVGFDLIFSGNDFIPESDQRFSDAIKRSGNVIIATHYTKRGELGPFPLIRDSAWKVGVVDKPRDSDYVIRRAYLSMPNGKEERPTWELEIFKRAFPQRDISSFPMKKSFPINYRTGSYEFSQIPFWKLLEGLALAREIQDKIVLVGLTAEAFHDVHATPLGPMPGIAINGNVILMMLRNDFLRVAHPFFYALFTFFSFWFALLAAISGSILLGFFMIFGLCVLYVFGGYLLLSAGVIFDPWLLMLGMLLVFIGMILIQQTQLVLENLRFREESSRDPLTGFFNRRFLALKLKAELRRLLTGQGSFHGKDDVSIVLIDLDCFTLINTSFGQTEGDRILRSFAETMRRSVRRDELISRYGNDEFCVILPGAPLESAMKFSEKIRSLIANHPDLMSRGRNNIGDIRVTASIGLASAKSVRTTDSAELLKAAERALHEAKQSGRNRTHAFNQTRDVAQ